MCSKPCAPRKSVQGDFRVTGWNHNEEQHPIMLLPSHATIPCELGP